jgi:hypothetical protein
MTLAPTPSSPAQTPDQRITLTNVGNRIGDRFGTTPATGPREPRAGAAGQWHPAAVARRFRRTHWRGFVLRDDRLWYRPPSGRNRRPGLRFEPEALVVVEPVYEQPLLWDEGETPDEDLAGPRPTWGLHAIPRARGNWPALRVTIGSAATGGNSSQVRLRAGARRQTGVLPALCSYLSTTPEARPGLADPYRLRGLLTRLAQRRWRRATPPREPLAGERLDLFRSVDTALDDLGLRRIDQRAVFGERRPAVDAVVEAVRKDLPEEVSARLSDERIEDEVRRHLGVGAWPFDALL